MLTACPTATPGPAGPADEVDPTPPSDDPADWPSAGPLGALQPDFDDPIFDAGAPLSFTVACTGDLPDSDAAITALALPAGASFDDDERRVSWTPTYPRHLRSSRPEAAGGAERLSSTEDASKGVVIHGRGHRVVEMGHLDAELPIHTHPVVEMGHLDAELRIHTHPVVEMGHLDAPLPVPDSPAAAPRDGRHLHAQGNALYRSSDQSPPSSVVR